MNIKKIILGIGWCALINASLFSEVAEYKITSEDKAAFNSLTSVWLLKFRSQDVRDQRIKDLSCLAALMMNRLLIIIKFLRLDFNVTNIEGVIRPLIEAALGKVNLFRANRYAVYEFEKSVMESKRKIRENWSKRFGRIPGGEVEKELNETILEDTLPKFNKNWSQVIRTLRNLAGKGTLGIFPDKMTIKSIKKLEEDCKKFLEEQKRTARSS